LSPEFEFFESSPFYPGGEFFQACVFSVTAVCKPMKMLNPGSAESNLLKQKYPGVQILKQRRARALIFFSNTVTVDFGQE